MREVREVLGVLRESEPPGLEALDDLVGSSRAAGLTVEVARHGDLDGLPPDTSRTAYRVLQEALTNAAKHAGPGRVQVAVRRTAGLLAVEVVDEGRAAPSTGPNEPAGARAGRDARAGHGGGRHDGGRAGLRRRLAGAGRAADDRTGDDVTIRVAVADDQALVRDGLRVQLGLVPDLEVVGEASTACRRSRWPAAASPTCC